MPSKRANDREPRHDKPAPKVRKGAVRTAEILTAEILIGDDLPPNSDHPLADLPPHEREEARIRELSHVLAEIAKRQANQDHQPKESQP